MEKVLKQIEMYYERLQMCGSTSGRKTNGQHIIWLLQAHPQAKQYWEYNSNEYYWHNKFTKIREYCGGQITGYTIRDHIVIDPQIKLDQAPSYCGLYFVGQTAFNPHTKEEQYWVKIGLSSDIKQRMKGYKTTCPTLYTIGYKYCVDYYSQEQKYQELLSQKAIGQCQHNNEWWLVDRNTYLEMCEKSYNYFE